MDFNAPFKFQIPHEMNFCPKSRHVENIFFELVQMMGIRKYQLK